MKWVGPQYQDHNIKTKIRSTTCYFKRNVGGLNHVDANEAFTTMLYKWILKFIDPSDSNVQILFKYQWSKSSFPYARLPIKIDF